MEREGRVEVGNGTIDKTCRGEGIRGREFGRWEGGNVKAKASGSMKVEQR